MSHHAGFRETTGTPTGESILDTVNGPGLALLFFGILVLGSTLTATGAGFDGWSMIGVLASVLCLVTGAAVVRIEHHRAREDHSINAGRNARRGTAG